MISETAAWNAAVSGRRRRRRWVAAAEEEAGGGGGGGKETQQQLRRLARGHIWGKQYRLSYKFVRDTRCLAPELCLCDVQIPKQNSGSNAGSGRFVCATLAAGAASRSPRWSCPISTLTPPPPASSCPCCALPFNACKRQSITEPLKSPPLPPYPPPSSPPPHQPPSPTTSCAACPLPEGLAALSAYASSSSDSDGDDDHAPSTPSASPLAAWLSAEHAAAAGPRPFHSRFSLGILAD